MANPDRPPRTYYTIPPIATAAPHRSELLTCEPRNSQAPCQGGRGQGAVLMRERRRSDAFTHEHYRRSLPLPEKDVCQPAKGAKNQEAREVNAKSSETACNQPHCSRRTQTIRH